MKKYIKVYSDIKNKITSDIYCEGEKLPTNLELAQLYNVSVITVKNALVMLKDEGYITSVSGVGTFVSSHSSLSVSPKKLTFSLIVPDFSEAFCLEIVNTFERVCRQKNIMPLISRSFGSSELEEFIIKEHLDHGTDGLCIMPVHDEYFNQELLKLTLSGFPLVTVDRILPSVQLSSVITDNRKSSEALAEYVISKHYNHPLVISPSFKNSHNLTQRVLNFIKHFEQHKILNYDNYIPDPNQKFNKEKSEMMRTELVKLIEQGVDVIFCIEYNLALDVKRFINQNNINIEIVCYDHPIASEKIKFTHIQQNQVELATQSINVLIDQLKFDNDIKHIEIPGTLVRHNN